MNYRRLTIPALLLSSLFNTSSVLADRAAVGDDGREILLKDNGQWEYRSNDRFATSEDGTRVRLKEDGRWEFIGNSELHTEEQARTENLDINLVSVITEQNKIEQGKRTRYDSQTVFNLDVDISSYGKVQQTKFNKFNLFQVEDDKGTRYPVIAVTPATADWQPGSRHEMQVRVDGSPAGSLRIGARKLTLTIHPSVFKTAQPLSFMIRTNEIKKKSVGRF